MQYSPVLLANAFAILGTLFWLLLFAALVWWLIWLLLRTEENNKNLVSEDPATAPPEADAPSEDATTTLPDTKTGAEPERPKSFPPSQAFTLWTKPPAAPDEEDAGSEQAPEEDDDTPKLDTVTAKEAAAQFQEELDSGNARQDELFGILFESAPENTDDLKEIKGVAKVLEGKLHDIGIYQFKQIAFWTDTATAEIGQRTSFRDRIYRDDWIAQAKTLHEKKYDEKL